MKKAFEKLEKHFEGKLYWDNTMRKLYATDASAYREMPLAVAMPLSIDDIQKLISFAKENKTSLIPRTAGTSLAGQVVGNGIVVDVSPHFTEIIEVNKEEKWVRVQPGVIRDDLNRHLKKFGLFFGPETSTANRAMIGGMIGNNSCGANSIVYGSTREHLLELKGVLSDGKEVEFKSLSNNEFEEKCKLGGREGEVYQHIKQELSNKAIREEIDKEFPKTSIKRRNTGYAVDLLKESSPFINEKEDFNFCKLLAGSEGTLAFTTEVKLSLNELPPSEIGLICIHFESIHESLLANLVALEHNPTASELMDHYILERTKGNIQQSKNRFFIKGDPKAILVVELRKNTEEKLQQAVTKLIESLKNKGYGYHYPVVTGNDVSKVWTLRKAGLGLLSNIPGDAKPVPVIEDTAVDVKDLPAYIQEFNEILKTHGLYCVHYAHAGSGELHLRPIINLKTEEGNQLFRIIADEIAVLVKKYKGSLSGEHGDGRLRGEYIPRMIGEKNFELLKRVKKTWDPDTIFNPGKIVDSPSMNKSLRYRPGQTTPSLDTILDFTDNQGFIRSAELCNGSGDCRKTELSGGTMCPSYMATRNERDTTRARANILREVLTHSTEINPFESDEIKGVMDLCLSCKGCKSECPSNVDVAKLKAEATYQYYKSHRIPLRTQMFVHFTKLNQLASIVPSLYNWAANTRLFKQLSGVAVKRSMPRLSETTLHKWFQKETNQNESNENLTRKVYLFCDEFTNYNDVGVGKSAIHLLTKLGYEVVIPKHIESGRTHLSKGMLDKAKTIAETNIELLHNVVSKECPLIGVEPSAILTFRDEYIDLTRDEMKTKAIALAKNVFTIEEFLATEMEEGRIVSSQFSEEKQLIKLHGHCHQKAISSQVPTKKMLSLPKNYEVQLIPSGCCGMAGSFGYEKEHYETSMKVGEL
ncbi:MAG: FAD-binding protein, partial [Cyclobacteriaceae bacterium]|nr:FAD-binding protein [Cyclobacteriaceae bacterium]